MEACTIRALKNVLVKVHDQVDRTRDFHIDVAFAEHQQMAVMRHNISTPGGSSAVVCVSPGVDVGFLYDRLRKLFSATTLIVQANRRVVVHHVVLHDSGGISAETMSSIWSVVCG